MKIAILGWASQGLSAYQYWNTADNTIAVCDSRTDIDNLPDGVETHLGDEYLHELDAFDLIVRAAPSIHPREIVAANSPTILDKVTSNTNEFMRVCPTKNVIGVTGTKGKGTTSTLIAMILEAAGKTVHLGGNIGTPPLDLLHNNIAPDDWVVLELANFQLIDFKHAPRIGVCLMIVPEHLNWHADFAEYLDAKRQLFIRQTPDDLMVYNAGDNSSTDLARSSKARKLWYKVPAADGAGEGSVTATPDTSGATVIGGHVSIGGTEICSVDEIALLGRHNWENVCAATAATWEVIGQDRDAVRSVVTTFQGLPHRLELLRELDGVKYYNDAFASAPDAAIAALQAIVGPKVPIVGGFDRMLPIDHLAQALKSHDADIRQAVLIGASAARLGEACTAAGFSNFVISQAKTMPEVVAAARAIAQPGDTIVLTPGFASFDMFKNFEDRGNQFKAVVAAL